MGVIHRDTLHYVKQAFSLRLDSHTLAALKRQAERTGQPPRTLAQRYVEEGLRQTDHPLIRFVDGPAGRRAALVGSGLDVWELIDTVRDNRGDADAAAEYLDIPRGLLDAAIGYYGAFTDEIDSQIEANERGAQEGYAAWVAGREALGA